MITLLLPHPPSETASAFVLQLKKIYAGAEVLANKSKSGPIKNVVDKKPAIVIVDAVAAGKATASYCNALKNNAKTCSSPILLIGDASSLKYRLEALEYGAEASLQLPAHNAEIKAQVNLLLNLTEKALVTDAAQIEPERFVSKILSSIPDAVFLTNERGDITFVSENVINLFGYTAGEFKKKKNIYEILGKQIISYKDIMESREIINIEHSVTNKSGEVLHALINVKAVNFGQGKMLFVCRDITSRKKEQMKVEESESRLKNIIKNAYAGYFFIDKDGFFKKVNQAWLNLHGYENENEILGKHFTSTQTEKDNTVASKIVGDALKGKKATFGEFTRVCKNGEIGYHAFTTSPVLENKKVIGLEGFLIDLTEHKKAVDNLHRYKNIVASVPDALAVINKNYQYEFVNKEYEKVSGLKRDQLLGKTIAEFLGNDKFEETIKPQYEKCLRGEEVHFQDWFIPPKGNKHFVDVSYFPYRTPKGEIAGIVASTRNITDKKLLEEKAGENRRQYKLLFEAASDFVFLHEFSAEKGAGKIWDVSNITLERLGYSKDEVLGKRPPDLTTDAGSEITKSSVELARLGKLKFEKVLVSKAGVKIPVEFHARVVEFRNTKMVLSIGRDISERKKAMESLKLSEEKFHKLFKSSPVPQFYWSFNGSDFILKEVNRAALELTLEKASDFIGMPAKEIYSDRSDLLERFHFCMKTRRNIVCETDYIARGTGLTRRVIFTFAYVSDELILLHTEDITKRKQTELELKESEEKFRSLISEMDHGLAVHEAVFDSHGKMTDYRFLDFNESFERQTGLKHAKIVGRTFTEILPGADLFWLEKYEEVVKTGKVAHFEKYEKQTGRYYEVVAYRNRENQFATVVSDITKRRENIKALNNHNKRLEVLTRILKHDSDDLNQLQSFTLEKAIELTESEIGFLFFYNSDTQKFSLTTWSESAKANCGVQNPPEVYDLCDSGCWGEAVRQRKPFILTIIQRQANSKKDCPKGMFH
ncbi:MAG TPA: PAS domain S-box protein [Prolixibacteraceae bacterium]|nr:PAS domain S-box protein [Prolixibacteraceae bacterium]